MPTPTDDLEPRVFHGVSLAQYADVQAGVGEGFELGLVLENERIDALAWAAAEEAWLDALQDDLARDGPLHETFDRRLAEAQDRYGRRIPPLDEEIRAWLDFIRHWSADPEPLGLLTRLGLKPTDLIRLQRLWARRLALDVSLAEKAKGILDAEPGQLPIPRPEAISFEGVRSRPRAAIAPEIPAHASIDDPSEANIHAVFDDLPHWAESSDEEPLATPVVQVTKPAPAMPLAAKRLSADASPWAADVLGTLDGALPRAEPALPFDPNAPSSLPAPGGAVRLARVASDVGGTVDTTVAPAGPPLPFAPAAELTGPAGLSLQQYASLCAELTAASDNMDEVLRRFQITAAQRKELDEHWQDRISAEPMVWMAFDRAYTTHKARFVASRGQSPPPAAPPVKRPPAALSETSIGLIAPQGPALPFTQNAGNASANTSPDARAAAVPTGAPAVKRAPAELSGTSMAMVVPKGPALPFTPGAAPTSATSASSTPTSAQPNMPPVKRAPAALSGTSIGAIVPKGPALPFEPGASSSSPARGDRRHDDEGHAAGVVGASSAGATLDAPMPPVGPPLPFAAPAEPPPAGLSLQQYASLCVELTAAPGDVEVNEVLRRYQITAAQRKALDEHWQGRIGSDLRVLAAFDRAHKEAAARFAASRDPSPPRTAAGPTSSAPAPSTSPPTNAPPVQRAPAALSATSIGVIAPKKAALPFKPQGTATGAPSEPSSPAPTLATMPPVNRAPSALSGTVIGTMAPKGAVLPFSPEAAAPSQPDHTAAEPPPSPAPSAEPPPSGLSLQQYASLSVELEVAPGEADKILGRYRVTAEQRNAIDAHWQGRMAADPRVRTVFDQAYAAYKAWFVASRRR